MPVEVTPSEFKMVNFDAGELSTLIKDLAAQFGLANRDIVVQIDETTPMARVSLVGLDPVTVEVEGGALEDLHRPRHFSRERATAVLAFNLLQVRDRLDPNFAGPAVDDELSLPQRSAWESYTAGRLDRAGFAAQRQRRLYSFRNRHGFTDVADAAFDRLWNSDRCTWAEILEISDSAAPVTV